MPVNLDLDLAEILTHRLNKLSQVWPRHHVAVVVQTRHALTPPAYRKLEIIRIAPIMAARDDPVGGEILFEALNCGKSVVEADDFSDDGTPDGHVRTRFSFC